MPTYNFHNITVSIEAENGKDAYTKLCSKLDKLTGGEWSTDTFSTDDSLEEKSTRELFPELF